MFYKLKMGIKWDDKTSFKLQLYPSFFFFFPFNEIDINCQYNGKIENLFIFKYKWNYKFPQSGGIKNDKPPNPL